MDRLFHVLKVLKVDIVLTQTSSSANLKVRIPGRTRTVRTVRTVESPVPAKQSPTKKARDYRGIEDGGHSEGRRRQTGKR